MEFWKPTSSVEETKEQFNKVLSGEAEPSPIEKMTTDGEFVQNILEDIEKELHKADKWKEGDDIVTIISPEFYQQVKDKLAYRQKAYEHYGRRSATKNKI